MINVQKNYFFLLTCFGYVFTILAWTKCTLVTNHVLSFTHFHSCFFFTFPFKSYLYKKFKLSIKDNLLLIYTFMYMIIFLRIIISKVTKPAFLARVWEWRGIDTDCPDIWNQENYDSSKDILCFILSYTKYANIYNKVFSWPGR